MLIKKYNNSWKKFVYINFVGPILGLAYIFINKLVLNYLYRCFLNDKQSNILILRSFIDFYYAKQDKVKKRELDDKLFFYGTAANKEFFFHYYENFDEKKLENEKIDLSYYLKKSKNFNFRNICQIGAAGGKCLDYFGKKFNFKNKIYSDTGSEQIRLAKQAFKNEFHYIECGAQNVDRILNDPIYESKNKDGAKEENENLDLFISINSIQYCSPIMLEDFFDKISKVKTKSLLLISEPIELDFLLREDIFMSRKYKGFNFKYDFFLRKAKIKILKKEIYNILESRKDKYFRNIGSYILIAEIN